MSKFKRSKYKPLTDSAQLACMTVTEIHDRGTHLKNLAATASRESAFLLRFAKQRKRAEAKAA